MSESIETLLKKLYKLQEDKQDNLRDDIISIKDSIDQTNKLLSNLIEVSGTGSTVAATKKYVPFQTGTVSIPNATPKPANPDGYPTRINVYQINDSRPVPHMTLINDGAGNLFFIIAYADNVFSVEESELRPNDQRELFNVYEVRLRTDQPLTTFRLIEGIERTGSFAPGTKANVENRPTTAPNETVLTFAALFEQSTPTITITSPTVNTLPTLNSINPALQNPLPPGHTAAFVDNVTGTPMPFTISEGFIVEAFSMFDNMSTDHTLRNWIELLPGTGIFTLLTVHTIAPRGQPINLQLNLSGQFSTQVIDPSGAPAGGRQYLFTVTNDDPFSNMIGSIGALAILRRLS